MRRLAAELGVDPMAAYRHVSGKDELLDLAMDELLGQVDLTGLDGSPVDQLRDGTRRVLGVLTAHPKAAPILSAQQWTTPSGMAIVEWGLGRLIEAGYNASDAVRIMNATGLFLVGLASAMTQADRQPSFDPVAYPVTAAALSSGAGLQSYDELLDFWMDAVLKRPRG